MNWEAVIYCCSLGTLIAGAFTVGFSPFCRPRNSRQRQNSQEAAVDRDRLATAMRQWAVERATADLEFTRLPPVVPAETEPAAAIREIVVEQAPPQDPEPEPEPEPEPVREDTGQGIAEPNSTTTYDFHDAPNFYEILQISPRADLDTIHRVYRIMAARYHPDNPSTGDHERFLELQEAYEVLSKPERRAQYDCVLREREVGPLPIFETDLFTDGLEAEINRRLGILALLYHQRRANQNSSGMSMLVLEQRMALPREHLDFTLWYLRAKGLVQLLEDNSDLAISASGVDFVEANSHRSSILSEVLRSAAAPPATAEGSSKPVAIRKKARRKSPAARGRRNLARA